MLETVQSDSSVLGLADTPVGPLTLVGHGEALWAVKFGPPSAEELGVSSTAVLDRTREQLEEYFAGLRREFTIPLHFEGTSFRRDVWRALLDVPFGATVSYAAIARRIGRPDAVRAVGAANGANPLAIVVPCHRIVGADGSLTGYGGGLDRKRWLLGHERRVALFGTP